MSEKPIPFSAPMVRAILNSSKTQTRRVVRPQPDTRPGMNCTRLIFKDRKGAPLLDEALEAPEPVYRSLCPYGQPGDRLWVREAFAGSIAYERHGYPLKEWGNKIWYIADGEPRSGQWTLPRPSIHMPRALSRITLEVTGVRVERLQDISEDDARAEGAPGYQEGIDAPPSDPSEEWSYRASFRRLWESINGPGSWDLNPWVWVVEFRRLPTNQRERA